MLTLPETLQASLKVFIQAYFLSLILSWLEALWMISLAKHDVFKAVATSSLSTGVGVLAVWLAVSDNSCAAGLGLIVGRAFGTYIAMIRSKKDEILRV